VGTHSSSTSSLATSRAFAPYKASVLTGLASLGLRHHVYTEKYRVVDELVKTIGLLTSCRGKAATRHQEGTSVRWRLRYLSKPYPSLSTSRRV
jgi:hypothetical protein